MDILIGWRKLLMPNKIKPLVKRCGCGKRTKHHHTLCDKCWELKKKINKIDK
jgi:hypothetical protein